MRIPELVGRSVTGIDASAAPQWIFELGDGYSINAGCWRVVSEARVVIAADDHNQRFGLDAPVDAAAVAMHFIGNGRILNAGFSEVGDLTVTFESGARLETFTDSAGYETCVVFLGARQLIVVGGGEVVTM